MADTKFPFQPLGDNVIIRPHEEQKEESLIVMPPSSKTKPSKFQVIAVGPGKRKDNGELVAMTVKVGDVVIASRYAGDEFKLDGDDTEYRVVHEDSILAVAM